MAAASIRKTVLSLLKTQGGIFKNTYMQRASYSAALRGLDTGKSVESKTVPALKWELCAAVCLTRPPIVSPKLTELERKYIEVLENQEFERSVLSDWELEKIRQADIIKAIETGEKDPDEMDFKITHQDREDEWELKMKEFEYPEDETVDSADVGNVQRVMRQPLTYVVNKKLGNDTIWMLPTAAIKHGETMRECAERALSIHSQNRYRGTILSNAPSAYYKYKFPKEVRLKNPDEYVGAKIFIYTALLKNTADVIAGKVGNKAISEDSGDTDDVLGYAWASKDELPVYLKPKYFAAVEKILM